MVWNLNAVLGVIHAWNEKRDGVNRLYRYGDEYVRRGDAMCLYLKQCSENSYLREALVRGYLREAAPILRAARKLRDFTKSEVGS